MTDRILGEDLLATALSHEPLPDDEVVAGAPTTATLPVGHLAGDGVEIGIWEMSEGVARDTEVDEVFVVLAGSGAVEFADGTAVALRPGTAVRLRTGEHTTWTVTERLRKLYVAG